MTHYYSNPKITLWIILPLIVINVDSHNLNNKTNEYIIVKEMKKIKIYKFN